MVSSALDAYGNGACKNRSNEGLLGLITYLLNGHTSLE